MPSRAAVERFYDEVNIRSERTASIIVPKEIHWEISETFAGRNKPAQIELDPRNVRTTLDKNFYFIKPALKEYGASGSQFEKASQKIFSSLIPWQLIVVLLIYFDRTSSCFY